jgi:hypothetical protein
MKPSNFRINRPSFSAKSDSFIISSTPIKSQNPDTPLLIKRNGRRRVIASVADTETLTKMESSAEFGIDRSEIPHVISHLPRRPVLRRPGEGGSQTKAGLATPIAQKMSPVSNRQPPKILNRHAPFRKKMAPVSTFPNLHTEIWKRPHGRAVVFERRRIYPRLPHFCVLCG